MFLPSILKSKFIKYAVYVVICDHMPQMSPVKFTKMYFTEMETSPHHTKVATNCKRV